MNTPPNDDDVREREWQIQERALHAERRSSDASDGDARLLRYRLLARALRQPPQETLPADFASDIARQISTSAVSAGRPSTEHRLVYPFDAPFERNLLRVLMAAFGLSIGIVIGLFGSGRLQPAVDAILFFATMLKNPWLLTFVVCLALSGFLQHWRRQAL